MKRSTAFFGIALLTILVSQPVMAAKNDQKQIQDSQNTAVYQKFLSDTATTRQELAGKRAEYQALMRAQNPDPAAAATLSKEIFTLQEKLRAQAPAQGFGPRGGYGYGNCPGYAGAGCGAGAGYGGGHGGRGMGMMGMGW